MRSLLALTIAAALIATAYAAEGEGAADTDVEHPTLPGLSSPCKPQYKRRRHPHGHSPRVLTAYEGRCVAEPACAPPHVAHGFCAGLGVVCCTDQRTALPTRPSRKVEADVFETAAPAAPLPAGSSTVLRIGASDCPNAGGKCVDKSTCTTGTLRSGLCPGASNIMCCVPPGTGPSMSSLITIPSGINSGLAWPTASFSIGKIGRPGCPLTTACFSCTCQATLPLITRNLKTVQVAPNAKITALGPFADAVARAFAAMNVAGGEARTAYLSVKTAGGMCCRPIKHSDGTAGSSWSNHSWGVAADFFFGPNMDPRGDGKTQYGLAVMAPFFQKEKLYWAAGYGGSSEDAMHFEASQSLITSWVASGVLK